MTPADVAAAREQLGLTRREFAAAIGVHYRTLQRYEGGGCGISDTAAKAITLLLMLQDLGQLPAALERLGA